MAFVCDKTGTVFSVKDLGNGREEWSTEGGFLMFLKDGKYHREDGPAIIFEDGTRCWALNGLYHRVGGPAIETAEGYCDWFLNGREVTKSYHDLYVRELERGL